MQLIKTANGKHKVKISKSQWMSLGKKAGWINKEAALDYDKWKAGDYDITESEPPECPNCDIHMKKGTGILESWECPSCDYVIEQPEPDSN